MKKMILSMMAVILVCFNANARTANDTVNTENANKVYVLRGNFEGRNFVMPRHVYHYDKYFFHQVSLTDNDYIVSSEPILDGIQRCLGQTARCMSAEVNNEEELAEFLKNHEEPVYVWNAKVQDMELHKEIPSERDKISMDIRMEFSLQDARTGAVVCEFSNYLHGYDASDVPTYAQAVKNAVSEAQNITLSTLYQYFPVQGQITGLASAKKDCATAVKINLGENQNLAKGVHFEVLKDGDPIAKLKVTNVIGDESKCKVLEGGSVLYNELNEGADLQLKTYVTFWN